MARPVKGITPEDRFWDNVRKTRTRWNWIAGKPYSEGGRAYGALRVGGRKIPAHRFSYELHKGPIPAGLLICHHCDNSRCVRPDHLFAGTQKDNVQDCKRKGRRRYRNAGLTAAIVDSIRKRFKPYDRKNGARAIAMELGMNQVTVYFAISGRRWRNAA